MRCYDKNHLSGSLSIWFWCLFFSVQKRRPPATIYPRYNKSSKELLFFSWGEHWLGFYDITYKITVWGKYSLQESNITLLCRSWRYWRTWSARKRCSTREIRVWSFAPNPWRLHSTKERFMLQKSGNTWTFKISHLRYTWYICQQHHKYVK